MKIPCIILMLVAVAAAQQPDSTTIAVPYRNTQPSTAIALHIQQPGCPSDLERAGMYAFFGTAASLITGIVLYRTETPHRDGIAYAGMAVTATCLSTSLVFCLRHKRQSLTFGR